VTARRIASGSTLLVLTGALLTASAPANGDDIRTDSTLGGFSIKTQAAPFRVLLDDPTLAIPHPPDTPVLEADPAFTAATLETGPASRALASSLWPGALFGDGMGTVTNGQVASYPLKADARYPDKPYTATDQGGGAFMSSQALGLDVKAAARFNPGDAPGAIDVGLAKSMSTATVKDGVAVGTAVSQLTDVDLMGGIIHIGSVSTSVTVKGNGKQATSDGSTVVTGLTVGGMGFVVDDKGVRPVGVPLPAGPALPGDALDPLKQLGITISGLTQRHTQDATTAARSAAGLTITVDTVVLRGVLNQLPAQLWDALYGIVDQMPAQLQGNLYYLLGATPKITFLLGAGQGTASASLPLSFQFPDLPTFPVGGVAPPVTGGVAQPPVTPVTGPVTSPVDPVVQPPTVAQPTTPNLVKAAAKDPFNGLPAGLVLLVLALAGVAGWGLWRVQSLAFLAGAAAGPCTDGTSQSLPDLRGA
jgi:hypothetical protein